MRTFETRSGTVTIDRERTVYLDGLPAARITKGGNIFTPNTNWKITRIGQFASDTIEDIELDCSSQREAILRMFEFKRTRVVEHKATLEKARSDGLATVTWVDYR